MSNLIYCFSLYCEGNGLIKTQAFVTIQGSLEKALESANNKNKGDFPPIEGWHNHRCDSMIVIPKERIQLMAKEYEAEEA